MPLTLTGISSMATRHVLTELTDRYDAHKLSIEAVGGVDAANRVRAGESFDLVILADNVIEKLESEGHILPGTRAGFVLSPMAAAIPSGQPRPDIGTAETLRTALLEASSIGYSTGPSGTHLLNVLKSWGLDPAAEPSRFVQAKPGVPVAALVANGDAAIGIQQLSELLGQPGIDVLGIVPAPIQSVTTFSIGIGALSSHPEEARAAIAYLNAEETIAAKRRFGLEPA